LQPRAFTRLKINITKVEIIEKRGMDLSFVIVTGLLSKEKMLSTLTSFYSNHPTSSVLCDLSNATWCNMPDEHIFNTMARAHKHAKVRKGCKTAVVVRNNHNFETTEKFVAAASAVGYGPEIQIFREISTASAWLEIPQLQKIA
jgi:hypothetical protein